MYGFGNCVQGTTCWE